MVSNNRLLPPRQRKKPKKLIGHEPGPSEDDHHHAQNAPTTPTKVATDGITIFLIETELPLMLTEYGKNAAMENFKVKSKGANKL